MAIILIVDDHPTRRSSLAARLRPEGHVVYETIDPQEARALLRSSPCHAILVAARLGRDADRVGFLYALKADAPEAQIILMGASDDAPSSVSTHAPYPARATSLGSYDYVELPAESARLLRLVAQAGAQYDAAAPSPSPSLSPAGARVGQPARADDEAYVAVDQTTMRLLAMARRIAQVDCSVLITGETGTGKERIARWLYQHSARRHGRFIPVNCGALPEGLIESELFGSRKGAFTGSVADQKGLIEEAHGGTLFLDEIGEMPLAMQVRLLRFLDNRELRRVGDAALRFVDVRVIAATNRPLEQEVRAGRFRDDLFYRLNVVAIHVPPLRERPADIPALVSHYLRRTRERIGIGGGRQATGFSAGALARLMRHRWPGNVRELQNVVERAAILAVGATITEDDLPAGLGTGADRAADAVPRSGQDPREIATALQRSGGNHARAAAALGISRSTLWRRMRTMPPMLATLTERVT